MPVIFEDGFEDGTIAAWTDLGSVAPTVVTSPVYDGSRALRSLTTAQQVRLEKTFTAGATWGAKFAIQRVSASDEAGILWRISNSDYTRGVQIQNVGATILLRYNGGAGDTTVDTGPAFTQGAWFLVDLKVNVSGNPWLFEWKVNGTDQGTSNAAVAATTFDRLNIGTFGFNMNWEVAHDRIMVSNEFSYIEPSVVRSQFLDFDYSR